VPNDILLGTEVRDKVTGFAGVAVARAIYLHGTARILIQSHELHKGKPLAVWFEEPFVERNN